MKKSRILELDILRAIAFIFIVIQHTIGVYSNSKMANFTDILILKFIYEISKIGVPIFITLTGMVLFYRYYDDFNLVDFYKKRIKYIFIPYTIWCIPFLIIKNSPLTFKYITMEILSGNSWTHLWYMGMVLRIYLYFPLIIFFTRKLLKCSKTIKVIFLVLYFIFYWWVLKNNNIISENIGIWIFKNPTKFQQKFINVTPVFWSIYFVIGIYIIFVYEQFKKIIWKHRKLLSTIYTITLVYSYYTSIKDKIGDPIPFIRFNHALHIFCCIISILFFYLIALYISNFKNKLYRFLKFTAEYSFPAYILHVFIVAVIIIPEVCLIDHPRYSNFISFVVNTLNHTWSTPKHCLLLFSIILCILTVVITPCICYLISFLPFSKYILGIKPKCKFINICESVKK
ncbi:acyltransferase [Haloimpatiens sp. FM7330]|uniref:acyltransferase n=1 Tax=Haloimpatiens sp. FM7330 TaxID=3298610 RepID=UPI003626CA92